MARRRAQPARGDGPLARRRVSTTIGALVLLMLSVVPGTWSAAFAGQQVDIDGYPAVRARDLPERYRAWIQEEVVWIITEPEREVFLRLDSDEKRDRFITAFWEHRDPTPGTPRNEYLPIHYERLAYANHEFGRVAPGPGWRSDMGRIHILLGEPQSRVRLHNDSVVYPVEVWLYQMDPRLGVPTFFYVVFFREQGMGEFRLYSPAADGPERLLNPSGRDLVRRQGGLGQQGFGLGGMVEGGQETYNELRFIHPDLAEAAFSLIPGEAFLGAPLRSDSVLADIFDIPKRVVPTIEWAYPILTGAAETEVRFETLSIEARAIGWLDPDGRPYVSYVARAAGAGINLGEHEGDHYMTFSVASYLLDGSSAVLEGPPPRLIQNDLSPEQVAAIRAGSLLFIDRVPAISGEMAIELMIENNVSHEYGEAGAVAMVPEPNPLEVVVGQPILCAGARALGAAYDPFMPQLPFQVGELAMTPTIDGPFASGGELYVFQQVSFPRDSTEPVRLSYALADADGTIVAGKQVRVLPEQADRFGVVNQLTGIKLDVQPGRYSLQIEFAGESSGVSLPVQVRHAVDRPIVHAAAVPPPTDPGELVRRASILRAAGQFDRALELVRDALARDPDKYEAQQLQVELLRDGGHSEELETILARRLIDSPHDIELLEQLAEVMARQGKHYDSIRFYERAVLERSDRVDLLNALAAEYLAEASVSGAIERAIELMTRSLQLDPDQSGVRATLERARAAQGAEH